MKKQRNFHALVDGDTSLVQSLSSNKASSFIREGLKAILHAIAMEIQQSLEEQFNQLKDGLTGRGAKSPHTWD